MKKILMTIIVAVLMLNLGCASAQKSTYEGGGIGAVFGGLAGALIDHKNPWRGGVVGASVGAVAGATVSEISKRAAIEAVTSNKAVAYSSVVNNNETKRSLRVDPLRETRYDEDPVNPFERTRCDKVRERVWDGDKLVKDNIKEICRGEKVEGAYK